MLIIVCLDWNHSEKETFAKFSAFLSKRDSFHSLIKRNSSDENLLDVVSHRSLFDIHCSPHWIRIYSLLLSKIRRKTTWKKWKCSIFPRRSMETRRTFIENCRSINAKKSGFCINSGKNGGTGSISISFLI